MSEANVQKLKDLYAAFGRGDINAITSNCADDVTWGSDAVAQDVPWYTMRHGRAGVGEFFSTLAREVDFTHFEPKLFAGAGDTVLVHVDFGYKLKKNGRTSDMHAVHEFTVGPDGLVRSFRPYEDTAKVRDMWNA